MAGYKPLKITAPETGLVQEQEDFVIPNDAFPQLENAYVWRGRIKRKQGFVTLGRLRRVLTAQALKNIGAAPVDPANAYNVVDILTSFRAAEPNASLQAGNVVISIDLLGANPSVFTDDGEGLMADTSGNYAVLPTLTITGITSAADGEVTTSGAHTLVTGDQVLLNDIVGMTELNGRVVTATFTGATTFTTGVATTGFTDYASAGTVEGSFVNYATGEVNFTWLTGSTPGAAETVEAAFNYYPCLPVMGIRGRELNGINAEDTIYFDTIYAYRFTSTGFVGFINSTTWGGSNSDFFWTTNYWVDKTPNKLFWITNFSGVDTMYYTNGTNLHAFLPQIDATNFLHQALILLPFRGRLLALNTFEGTTLALSLQQRQRIRWSAIGTPITLVNGDVSAVNANAWRDEIIGQGGFLDIPTAEDIVTAGFVRDNLVIYCERSTWQLRYTGRSIAPFQIEKVNTELGADSTFSAVNFDTSLIGIGDKGIVECDSFKSERIDTKIPDLVFERFSNDNNGPKRVHGVRDLKKRLVYWIYPEFNSSRTFPNRRLVLNYDNGSWAIFKDLFTTLGPYQADTSKTWAEIPEPWESQNYEWISRQGGIPLIAAGNQQGYIVKLDRQVDNTESFHITGIVGAVTTVTTITSPNHNLVTGDIIEIVNIPNESGYVSLNNTVFGVYGIVSDDDFTIATFDADDGKFSAQQIDPLQTYLGGGEYRILDNFKILSKKFDHMDVGEKIQLGHIDILASKTASGAFSMKLFSDYRSKLEMNQGTDSFFNTIVPTTDPGLGIGQQDKYWHRVFCNIRSNFIQIEYSLSNAQMNGSEQSQDIEIDAQILYERAAGRIGI